MVLKNSNEREHSYYLGLVFTKVHSPINVIIRLPREYKQYQQFSMFYSMCKNISHWFFSFSQTNSRIVLKP